MNKTKIEWTDYTWNPVTGCNHGCDYCYAKAISKRFKRSFKPQFHENRLEEPGKLKKSAKIFVCSMADLFGEWVPEEWILKIIEVAAQNPQHIFQFLTKNPDRYKHFTFPENCWLGATATNQEQYQESIQKLRISQFPGVRFISFEPLISEIDPYDHGLWWLPDEPEVWMIDWLVLGAMTGPGAKQPDKEWTHKLVEFADKHHIPIFIKNNLTEIDIWHVSKEFPQTRMVIP